MTNKIIENYLNDFSMFSTSTLVLLSFKIHWCIFTVGKRNLDLFISDIGDNIFLNLYLMLTDMFISSTWKIDWIAYHLGNVNRSCMKMLKYKTFDFRHKRCCYFECFFYLVGKEVSDKYIFLFLYFEKENVWSYNLYWSFFLPSLPKCYKLIIFNESK